MGPLPINSCNCDGLPRCSCYTMVFCHLETLSSSLSSSLHLTQLAATTTQGELFRPIVPPDLTKYLDSFKLGGDLLMNLNMTREDDGDCFLFRRRFQVVTSQSERLECVSEEEALKDFLAFMEASGENIILVCVDEDTVSDLLGKLKALDRRRVTSLVSGFTWWRRSLKYLSVQGYRDLELESHHQEIFPSCPPPSLYSALVVASMLKSTLLKMDTAPGSSICLNAVPTLYRARARPREVEKVEEGREVLELYTSFRPETTTYITADKLDQVDIGSDSEDECANRTLKLDQVTRQQQEVLVISSDSECEDVPIGQKSLTTIPLSKQVVSKPLEYEAPSDTSTSTSTACISGLRVSNIVDHPSCGEDVAASSRAPRCRDCGEKVAAYSRAPQCQDCGEKVAASSRAPRCQECGLPLPAQQLGLFFCTPCLRSQLLSDEAESDNNPLEDDVQSDCHSLGAGLKDDMDVEYLGSSVSGKNSNNNEDIAEKNCVTSASNPQHFWEFKFLNGWLMVVCPMQKCRKSGNSMRVINLERHMRKVHYNHHMLSRDNIDLALLLSDIGCRGCGDASVSLHMVAEHVRCIWQEKWTEKQKEAALKYIIQKQTYRTKKQTTQPEKRNTLKDQQTNQEEKKTTQEVKSNTPSPPSPAPITCPPKLGPYQPPSLHRPSIIPNPRNFLFKTAQKEQTYQDDNQVIQKLKDTLMNQIQAIREEKQAMQTTPYWLKSSTSGKLSCPYQACTDFLVPDLMEKHLAEHHPNFLTLGLSLTCSEVHCTEELPASQVAGHLVGHTEKTPFSQVAGHAKKLLTSQVAGHLEGHIHNSPATMGKFWVLVPNSVFLLNCPKCPKTLSLANVQSHMDEVHQSKEERLCCKCNLKVAVVDVRNHFKDHITGGTVQKATGRAQEAKKRLVGWITDPNFGREDLAKKRNIN